MPELKLDMTIPLGNAGYVHLEIYAQNIDHLTPQQRQVIADTGAEFYAFAAATLTPPADGDEPGDDAAFDELRTQHDAKLAAVIHNTDGDVLRGVTGSRHQP